MIQNGNTRTLVFDSDGALLSTEEEIALAETPAVAKVQIQTLAKSGKVIGVTKVTENGVVSFGVDVREQGKVKSYTVAENGTQDSVEEK